MHVHEMGQLPEEGIKHDFLNGLHVCHHHNGATNVVLQDQVGEQISIRYGKGRGHTQCGELVVTERVVLTHPL